MHVSGSEHPSHSHTQREAEPTDTSPERKLYLSVSVSRVSGGEFSTNANSVRWRQNTLSLTKEVQSYSVILAPYQNFWFSGWCETTFLSSRLFAKLNSPRQPLIWICRLTEAQGEPVKQGVSVPPNNPRMTGSRVLRCTN